MIFVTYFNVMTFRTALLPPLLHLLGIDTKNNIQVGSNVLSDEHDEIVLFRNGGFVSPAIYSILGLSGKVVSVDLFRYYTPKGYTPVDPSQFNYNKQANVESDE
ncbi:hypothetical protein [Sporosarcina newyorkensis]|uniref:hypothetical protein n=1 Tax=Sporosarcina newyorkensis TaxID=759851 RepID=UPI003D02D7E0